MIIALPSRTFYQQENALAIEVVNVGCAAYAVKMLICWGFGAHGTPYSGIGFSCNAVAKIFYDFYITLIPDKSCQVWFLLRYKVINSTTLY